MFPQLESPKGSTLAGRKLERLKRDTGNEGIAEDIFDAITRILKKHIRTFGSDEILAQLYDIMDQRGECFPPSTSLNGCDVW